MTRTTIIIAAALAVAAMQPAAPALSQRARVFVASYGSDSNPCTFGSPCKTFQNAVNVVAAGGEVTAIDSAGFGTITINHAVTITSPNGVEAGIAAGPGDYAILINAGPSDTVVLRGLTLEGAATGRAGIVFNSGTSLEVTDCTVHNFTDTGIAIGPSSGMNLLISNTRVLDNTTAGINFVNNGSGFSYATIDHVTANNNGYGIFFNTNGDGRISGVITNSVVNSNVNTGVAVSTASEISIKYSTISNQYSNNQSAGISVLSDSAAVLLSHTLITNNYNEIVNTNGGTVFSAGNNDILPTDISGSVTSLPQQ